MIQLDSQGGAWFNNYKLTCHRNKLVIQIGDKIMEESFPTICNNSELVYKYNEILQRYNLSVHINAVI